MEKAFSAQELAERYGYKVTTLTEWRYKGKGPRWFKAGKKVFYHESAVLEWEREQAASA